MKKGLMQMLQQPLWVTLLFFVNRALLAILTQTFETDLAVYQCEQGIIAADPNVLAGMDVSASLANQNIACQNELTICTLYAQSLGLGVTAVTSGAAALFVCKEL